MSPFIAVWPQKIKPNTVSHELVVNTDLLATFASLVNRPLSDEDVVDSNNLMPLFINPEISKGTLHCYKQVLIVKYYIVKRDIS